MALTADDLLAQEQAREAEYLATLPDPADVHPSVPDGLGLVAKLEEHFTPLHMLTAAIDLLKRDEHASTVEVYAALVGTVGHLTLLKARSLLETGMPPPSAVSAHPLDAIRVARGEKAAFPLADFGAADRAAAKTAAAELAAERAKSEALLARLEEAEAKHAKLAAEMEYATSPATGAGPGFGAAPSPPGME